MKTGLPKLTFLVSLGTFAVPALAHMVSMSSGELQVNGSHAHYELRMPSYELVHMQDPKRTLLNNIHFRSGIVEGKISNETCTDYKETYLCEADYEFPSPVDAVEVDCMFARVTVPNHVHLLHASKGEKGDQAVFDFTYTTAELRFRPPTEFEIWSRATGGGLCAPWEVSHLCYSLQAWYWRHARARN